MYGQKQKYNKDIRSMKLTSKVTVRHPSFIENF